MEINVSSPQLKSLALRWNLLSAEIKPLAQEAMAKCGEVIADKGKEEANKLIYNTPISASGYVRTHLTGDTINTQDSDISNLVVKIGPHTNYAVFVEMGTYKMPARPFMQTGLKDAEQTMNEIFKNLTQAIINKMK